MNNKIYILQKDLPNITAGNEFKEVVNGYIPVKYGNDCFTTTVFSNFYVENNLEWFKLKEDPTKGSSYKIRLSIVIAGLNKEEDLCPYHTFFYTVNKPTADDFQCIKNKVESIFNQHK